MKCSRCGKPRHAGQCTYTKGKSVLERVNDDVKGNGTKITALEKKQKAV